MTPEESKAYSKGYAASKRRAWPSHRPPEPPNELFAGVIRAGQAIRDEFDTICATFSDDDELVIRLAPLIDEWDDRMKGISSWLAE